MVRHHAYELVAKAVQKDTDSEKTRNERQEDQLAEIRHEIQLNTTEENDSQQTDLSQNTNQTGSSQGTITWSHEAVLLLISLYSEHKELFNNNLYKQKDVWIKISKGMEEKGHHFQPHHCDSKWRALKHRHKVITDDNGKSGRGRRTWQYFDAMNEVLAGDPAVRPLRVMGSTENVRETTELSETNNRSKPPLPPTTLRIRTPSPSLRPSSPSTPVRTHSPSPSDNGATGGSETPVLNRKRKRSGEPPEWFRAYAEQANRRMDSLEESNRQMIAIARERNSILKTLAEALAKQ
ncbi:uncharacterized protein LOC132716908 isoform X2 [Ruditapes philippinarum]|nr:uncharacterized protein LOC132716908 isoform X2 [Ruditapes philippinarum]